MWVSAPLITFSDCEGAGEAFVVTTAEELQHLTSTAVAESTKENNVDAAHSSKIDDGKGKEEAPFVKDGEHPFEKYFFREKAYLTVSGQLEGEAVACGM